MVELLEGLKALNPEWQNDAPWRSYATAEIERLWPSFNDEQRLAIAAMLEEFANDEYRGTKW